MKILKTTCGLGDPLDNPVEFVPASLQQPYCYDADDDGDNDGDDDGDDNDNADNEDELRSNLAGTAGCCHISSASARIFKKNTFKPIFIIDLHH